MILEFLKKEWKYFTGLLIILLIICGLYYEYSTHKAVPMATVQSVNYTEVAKAMQVLGLNKGQPEIQRITDTIIKETQGAPQVVYVTSSQGDADKKAKEIAKADKADAVIKESTDKITNKYYGIRTTRPWGVSGGLGYESGSTYIPIEFEREYKLDKTVSLEIHVQPFASKKITGGEIKFGWKL